MNVIQQNSQEARSQRLQSRLCFSGLSEEHDSRPGLWLAEAFSISPLKPLNGIQQNLTGRKISTPSNKFVFSGRSEGKDGRPASDLPRHFDFSSVTAEQNSTKLDRKQNFNVLYQVRVIRSTKLGRKQDINFLYKVCFFWADEKNKMAAPASDWLRHFRLLLWTEFNKTWQEIRYVNAIFQVCVFRADRKNILLMFTICGPWASCLCIK